MAFGLSFLRLRNEGHNKNASVSVCESAPTSTAEVLVYLDAAKAVAAGLRLYRSANGVLLSPGDERGVVSTAFFARVVVAATGEALPVEDADSGPRPNRRERRKQLGK